MNYKIGLQKNSDDTYDIVIDFEKASEEMGLDFFTKRKEEEDNQSILEYVKEKAGSVAVKGVRVLVAGTLVAAMSLPGFMTAFAAAKGKYSMTYLYTGSASQQIEYVNRTKDSLNTVAPSYFDIAEDGLLKVNTISKSLVDSMHAQGIKVTPFLSNHWDRQAGIDFLADYENNAKQLAGLVAQHNLDGINVDIENVTHNEREQYSKFVAKLRELIPKEKTVSVAVAANPKGWTQGWHGSYDYKALSEHADYLFIMAYDEHYQGGEAGPVASQSFVENSVTYALKYAPSEKIVLGLPFFGRIWGGNGTAVGLGLDLTTAETLRTTYNGKITFDTAFQSPKMEFTIKAGDKVSTINGRTLQPGSYTVWFENDNSLQSKLSLINKYNLKGAGSWALGKEPSTLWNNYTNWLNGTTSTPTPNPGTGSNNTGSTTNTTKTGTVVNANRLNVRKSASTKSKILASLKRGTKVTILSTSKGWHKIRYSGSKTGYVSTKYISTASTSKKTKTTTANLNVRAKASATSKRLGTLKKGTKVTVTGTSGKFSKITYKGKTAYVHSSYLK